MSLVKVTFLVYVVSVLASGSTTDSSIIHATLELTNCEEKGNERTFTSEYMNLDRSDLNHSILTICRAWYMLWFKFISSSNFFKLVHIF